MKNKYQLIAVVVVIASFFAISPKLSNPEEPFFVESDNIAVAEALGGCVYTANWSCYSGSGYPYWIIENARYEMPHALHSGRKITSTGKTVPHRV
jgi:hypothetical protein